MLLQSQPYRVVARSPRSLRSLGVIEKITPVRSWGRDDLWCGVLKHATKFYIPMLKDAPNLHVDGSRVTSATSRILCYVTLCT